MAVANERRDIKYAWNIAFQVAGNGINRASERPMGMIAPVKISTCLLNALDHLHC